LPILLNFLSIPAQPGPAAEFLHLPHVYGEKTRAARQYSQLGYGTQVKMRKNQGKMKIFSGHCGFFGQKQRFLPSLDAIPPGSVRFRESLTRQAG